jgi:two-component system cell cycle sensor histidine kinase/response regulator CckA
MSKPKVLYIDDEKANLTSFKYLFKSYFDIYIAETAEEGYEILKQHEIPVVISDHRMPGTTGTEFFENIYRDNPEQIRILLTGYTDIETLINAVNKGHIYRYIKKPFDIDEINIEIKKGIEFYSLKKENKSLIEKLKDSATKLEKQLKEENNKNLILEMISKSENISLILEFIINFIEALSDDVMRCSIMIIDESGNHFKNGASPNLTEPFIKTIESYHISEKREPCGSSAFLKKPVIVEDIEKEQFPDIYKELARKNNLRACWSYPILSSEGVVLGTFAMYFEKPRAPNQMELSLFENAVYLSSIAIEKEKTEKALKESEELYRLITENSSDIIIKTNMEAKYSFVSPAVEALRGYKPQEMLGKSVKEFIHPADVKSLVELTTEPIITNGYTCRALKKDGTYSWFENRIKQIISTETGELKELLIVSRDISERMKHEEKILEQASLIDKAQDAIMVIDFDDRIKYWNESATRYYGWTKDETIGKKLQEIPFNMEIDYLTEAKEMVLKKGEWHSELSHINSHIQKFTVESRWSLIKDSSNKPLEILIINTDITERKKFEKQIFHSQRIESIGTLASGIAHEINNIFTPILMSVKYIRRNLTDATSLKLLETIKLSVERGSEIVKQVLLFARTEESKFEVIEISGLISEIKRIINQTFPKNISIKVNKQEKLWPIIGNNTQLHQVLINMCLNARDEMENGGRLLIEVQNIIIDQSFSKIANITSGKYIQIIITDTGKGIPEDVVEKIFDPFFTTKEVGKGTGLGLSTSLAIIKNHNGFINVSSEVNQGTTFKIYLPALDDKKVSNLKVAAEIKIETGKGECILVVDDEVSILTIIQEILENNGYQVLIANNGNEALNIFSENKDRIGMVLMDINMPLMDGNKASEAIHNINRDLPVILSSGLFYKDEKTLEQNMNLYFLSKPYTEEMLLEVITNVLSKK